MWITPEPSTTSVVFRPPPSIGVRCWGCRGAGMFRRPTTEWGKRLMLNDDLDGQRGAWHHPQVRYDRHAIRRRQFALRRRERCKRTMIRLCCMSVAVMFAAMMNWALLRVPSASAGEEVFAAVTLCTGRQAACRAVWLWPVGQPAVIADFDPPDRPWLSGHRGVDLQASDGDELYAPADGIISFAGSVGGKSVVSVNTVTLCRRSSRRIPRRCRNSRETRRRHRRSGRGIRPLRRPMPPLGSQEGPTAKRGDGDDIS